VATDSAGAALFRCHDGRVLQVQYGRKTAKVLVEGRSYVLVRKPSRLGNRFTSPTAALIIDGAYAAFAAEDLYDLQGCRSSTERRKA
jgi:hypothetical protein